MDKNTISINKNLRLKIEQIIRSNSPLCDQAGYDFIGSQLNIREYLSPSDYVIIYKNIDWLSL